MLNKVDILGEVYNSPKIKITKTKEYGDFPTINSEGKVAIAFAETVLRMRNLFAGNNTVDAYGTTADGSTAIELTYSDRTVAILQNKEFCKAIVSKGNGLAGYICSPRIPGGETGEIIVALFVDYIRKNNNNCTKDIELILNSDDASEISISILKVQQYIQNNLDYLIENVLYATNDKGNLPKITCSDIDNFRVIDGVGTFKVFKKDDTFTYNGKTAEEIAEETAAKNRLFEYSFSFGKELSEDEKVLVPQIRGWEHISETVKTVCKSVKESSSFTSPKRNFVFRGPSSTGKSIMAREIAAGLGKPFVIFTCSEGTGIEDLVGQLMPKSALGTLGMTSFSNIPSIATCMNEPEKVYAHYNVEMDVEDMEAVEGAFELVINNYCNLVKSSGREGFEFVYSPLLRAIQNGWVVEIQEPTAVRQQAAFVGLNSILEGGLINLPTGQLVKRHPDSVVIMTMNEGYNGLKKMNQSVLDRCMIYDIDFPDEKTIRERVARVCNVKSDSTTLIKMVEVMLLMQDKCKNEYITSGEVSIRKLIDWVDETKIFGFPYAAALHTIVSGASSEEEERDSLVVSCLAPKFGESETAVW